MLEIKPFEKAHLEDAAALVIHRYTELCQQEPLLPVRYQHSANILPHLQNMLKAGCPGVAATQNGRLVGFLMGWLMPSFRGKRSTYSPEWANASLLANSRYIYEEMYRVIAGDWAAEKYVAHYLSIFTNDLAGIEALHWLNFGMLSVDAIRSLQRVTAGQNQVEIRHASLDDLEAVIALNEELRQYMRAAPIFFIAEAYDEEYFIDWIQDSDREIFLAFMKGEPVAFLRVGPANPDVAAIIFDEKTTSIYGAFTKEAMRGQDIGTSLLACAVERARNRGYERFAVDFETMNLLGSRFWLRHFNPVSYSLLRYLDERAV